MKNSNLFKLDVDIEDIEDTLFYLSKIEAIKIEGGFLVVYNRLTIERTEQDNKRRYRAEDYQKLSQFYENKVQQIHIVGEYAKKMIRSEKEALRFASDYFNLDFSIFLKKYFPGPRQKEIERTLTPRKYRRLFGSLSARQLEIINDDIHRIIVVAAGPGDGRTAQGGPAGRVDRRDGADHRRLPAARRNHRALQGDRAHRHRNGGDDRRVGGGADRL